MLAARLTFSASPSISRLLSSRWVWTPNPASINRMFSSRVPKRLSTPRLMRTLDLIKWVLDTSKQGIIDDKGYRLTGKDSKLRPPAGTGCRTPSTVIIPRSVKPRGSLTHSLTRVRETATGRWGLGFGVAGAGLGRGRVYRHYMVRIVPRSRFAGPAGSSYTGGGRARETPAFHSTQRRTGLTCGHTRRLLSVAPRRAFLWDTFLALAGHTVRERVWTNSTRTFRKSLRCFSKRSHFSRQPKQTTTTCAIGDEPAGPKPAANRLAHPPQRTSHAFRTRSPRRCIH